MIKIITNAVFVGKKNDLAYDVYLEGIDVEEDGFYARVIKRFKNAQGQYIDDSEVKIVRDLVFLPKENAQNRYNGVISDLETKIINKYT